MRITTLNLRHGGSRRAEALADWLAGTGSDVLVLSEFHRGPAGDRLTERLASLGYDHALAAEAPLRSNTVALLSRSPTEAVRLDLPAEEAHRVVAARVDGITVAGVYFAQSHAKRPLFEWLLGRPGELSAPALVIGDFNTGLHRLDEAGATFHCAAEFEALPKAGWVDAWRLLHGAAREFSWFSTAGNGFRIDHALVSPDLTGRVVAATYDHSTRMGLTDHSALTVEVDWPERQAQEA